MSKEHRFELDPLKKAALSLVSSAEPYIPRRKIPVYEGDTSYEDARTLSSQSRWVDACASYYKLLTTESDPTKRADICVNLSQDLINLGRFTESEKVIAQLKSETTSHIDDERQADYYLSCADEKQAWICDYRGKYNDEVVHLNNARERLDKYAHEGRTDKEAIVYSTTEHFLGRAHLGAALMLGKSNDRERGEHINEARTHFRNDLKRFETLRTEGKPMPLNEWFNQAWLVRCDIADGNIEAAKSRLESTKYLMDEFLDTHHGDGAQAHYEMMRGVVSMLGDDFDTAQGSFENAYNIRARNRSEGRPYPKGEADALMGLAGVAWVKGNKAETIVYGYKAIKTYPPVLVSIMP